MMHLRGVHRNIILLGVVSFLNDVSSEMIIPILPLFIAAVGGGGLIVGLIGGLQESIASIVKVLAGYWSDRIGRRKPLVFGGYLISTCFKLILAFATRWPHILFAVSFERIGKGIRTAPRDAIIADSMPEARGTGFGIHRAFDTLGAIIGSITVLLLLYFLWFDLEQLRFFQLTIIVAALTALLSLTPLHFLQEQRRAPREISLQISLGQLQRPLKQFIAVASIFALANFTYMFFILQAAERFTAIGVQKSIALTLFFYVLFNFCYALLAIPCGALSDRIGKRRVLITGYLLFAVTCSGFALFQSLLAFLILFPLYGVVYALVDGNQRAFVCDLSTDELRATALGTFHTMIGLMTLPASVIAGYLWNLTPQHELTFLVGAAVSLSAVLLFLMIGPRAYGEGGTARVIELD